MTRAAIDDDVMKLAEARAEALVTLAGNGSPGGGVGLLIGDHALWLQIATVSRVSHNATQVRAIVARAIAEAVQEDRVRSAALVEGAMRRATERERERGQTLIPLAAEVVDAAIAWIHNAEARELLVSIENPANRRLTAAVHAYKPVEPEPEPEPQ